MALERVLIRPTADVRELLPASDTAELATIDYAGAMAIGGTNATSLALGRVGITTTVLGDFQVDGTTTLVSTMTAQGDVNLGDGGDTINLGSGATDAVNLKADMTVSAGVLIDLLTSGGHINLPTEVQAPATDGTDGTLRIDVSGTPDILQWLDLDTNAWKTVAYLGGVTLDYAYDGGGAGLGATVTVDAADVLWNLTGAYSFVVDAAGCTGAADGFFVEDGTDYFRLTHAALNTLGLKGVLGSFDIEGANFGILNVTGGSLTLDSSGTLELNSSAGVIHIGNDAVAQNIEIGNSAAARTIIVGNATSTEVEVNAGIVDINAGTTVTIDGAAGQVAINGQQSSLFRVSGAANQSLTLSAMGGGTAQVVLTTNGTGGASIDINATAGGVEIDAVSGVAIEASAGGIDIGTDAVAQNISIGTAGARVITLGSAAATNIDADAVAISIDASDNSNFTVTANDGLDKSLVIAITNAGVGDGQLLLDSDGILELNSSAGVISIGNDAVNQNINIGTAGVRTVAVGSAAATAVTLDAIALSLDASATSNLTITANAVGDQTLTIACTNAGAGRGYIDISSQDQLLLHSTVGALLIDAANVLELNSSAAAISIGNDAVNQNINIGTAGVRTVAVGSAAATAVTLDAIAISLDSSDDSNFTLTANAAINKTLTLSAINVGAGSAVVSIAATDAMGGGTVNIDGGTGVQILTASAGFLKMGTLGSTVATIAGSSWDVDVTGDITFDANACVTPVTYNQAGDLDLDGFVATSIIGALNELHSQTLENYVLNAATLNFNDTSVTVLLVQYTATGACTITINSAQIAIDGRTFTIKDIGGSASLNNITIETAGAETIDGNANAVLVGDYDSITLHSDGSNLWVI